jgi:DNA-binding NarL/FixJ family response regulator
MTPFTPLPIEEETKIRILVVDDHCIVRLGLIALMNTEPDLEVVAEADDGVVAVELFAKLRPDLVLLDLMMPGKTGIEVTAQIREIFPQAAVLILTAFNGDEDIRRALDAGAQGYVLKSSTGEELIPAIRAVASGRRWIPREVALLLNSRNAFETLTDRELQVLHHVAKGLSNKELADVLRITEYTVKDHLKSILAKLQVADRTKAVTAAIERGIIHL